MRAMYDLPPEYEADMARLLATISTTDGVEPAELTGFWPLVGDAYERRLLVMGRAVNQWIDKVTLDELLRPHGPERFAAAMRRTTGWRDGDPMGWVTEAWGRGGGGYSTARSAFWRMARRVLERVDPESADDPLWSSRLAWSNTVKIAPWAGGNPKGPLLDIQREHGPGLIAREVATLRPELVLVLTGRWWFEPIAAGIGLDVEWRTGLLEDVAGTTGWICPRCYDLLLTDPLSKSSPTSRRGKRR